MERIEAERRAPFGNSPAVGERGARTQRRLIDAGLSVFADRGYAAASVEAITDVAGCSRASFYQYFASKEDLFLRLTSIVANEQYEILERLEPVDGDRAGRDALEAWLARYVAHYQTYRPVFAAYTAASQFDPTITRGAAAVSRRLARSFASKVRLDESSGSRPTHQAHVIMTIVSRAVSIWHVAGTDVDDRRLVDGLADLVHRCLYGPLPGINSAVAPSSEDPMPGSVETAALHDADAEARTGTRAALRDAGLEIFPALGHHGTRVDDIVTRAGVAHGTFYRYFDDKNDLFGALAADAAGQMVERFATFPRGDDPPALRRWLGAWFDAFDENLAIIGVWVTAAETDPVVRDLGSTTAARTGAAVVDLLRGRSGGDLEVDAIALMGLLERAPFNVRTLELMTGDEAVSAMTDVVRRGFLLRR